ncbi:MAG: hypothetical protein ACRYHQ_06435 [Janthinobacterium lividum]
MTRWNPHWRVVPPHGRPLLRVMIAPVLTMQVVGIALSFLTLPVWWWGLGFA